MRNLQLCEIVNSEAEKIQYHIYSHNRIPAEFIGSLIAKKSLWEPADTVIVRKTKYQVIKIVAADGWEDAD